LQRRSSNPNRDEVMPIAENTFTQARMPAPPVDAVHNGMMTTYPHLSIIDSHEISHRKQDHTRLGGFHRARRHMSDDEITEFLDSGKWRVRIVK
jgi:hypothetical protein